VVTFTQEQRAQVLRFRMQELEIPSIAELARRADVDKGNLSKFLAGEQGVLGPSLRARIADVLEIDRAEFALLLGDDSILVPIDLWRELRGGHEADDERRELLDRRRAYRELEPKAAPLPGPKPRW
jgi:transcriptional regulator with XRE-family HTH domain